MRSFFSLTFFNKNIGVFETLTFEILTKLQLTMALVLNNYVQNVYYASQEDILIKVCAIHIQYLRADQPVIDCACAIHIQYLTADQPVIDCACAIHIQYLTADKPVIDCACAIHI